MITPCTYETPLAPLPASELEDRPVDLGAIRDSFATLSGRYDAIVVEGAGGLMVPISEGYFMRDLAAELGLGLVVAASPWLGTINHTLLTINEARRAGIEVRGIIVSYCAPGRGGPDERTNPWMLGRLSRVPLIGVLPYLESLSAVALGRAAEEFLDPEAVRAAFGL